jgi:hypothetical protein
MSVEPRAPVHRGSVEAAGFVLDLRAIGEPEARQRVLALYQPGVELYALPGEPAQRWVVRLARTRRAIAELAPGAVLTGSDGCLLSAALSTDELRALDPPPGSVVLVSAGQASTLALAACARIDPAAWLDVGDYTRLHAVPLALPARPVETAVPAVELNARRVLNVPDAAPEQAALLEALDVAAAGSERARGRTRLLREPPFSLRALGRALSALGMRAGRAFARAFARLSQARGAGARSGGSGGAASGGRGQARGAGEGLAAAPPRGAGGWGWPRRALDWLNARARRWLYWSRLGDVIGRWQARYLSQTLELFERGDFENALRHAIPLGDGSGEGPQKLAIAPPSPRADLTIDAHHTPASTTLPLGEGLMALLRERYNQAARALIERGRIEEAAFVYAVLLGDVAAAVALLERHGQLRKAAELAEGRKLTPAVVVRLWILCGEIERALLIARRDGAFAQALALLANGHPEQAKQLRLAYADALAEAGDYAGAADVLWPLREARALAGTFLERASLAGGVQAGRSLARMLELEHDPARTLARIDELLHDRTVAAVSARLGLAEGLLSAPATAAVRRTARATIRALIAERERVRSSLPPPTLDRLLKIADDAALRADFPLLPRVPPTRPLAERPPMSITYPIAATDVGTLAIEDAALLPNGRLLVALGDAGLRLYAPDLRTYTHFREPAERLVLNPQGTRALVLAQRGRLWRIARLELIQRRIEGWCDLELDSFARSFDGSRWWVMRERDLLALDATADGVRALCRVPALGTAPGAVDMVLTGRELDLLLDDEYFGYELDPLVLRRRKATTFPEKAVAAAVMRLRPGTQGEVVRLGFGPGAEEDRAWLLACGNHRLELGAIESAERSTTGQSLQLHVTKTWAAAATPAPDGTQVHLVNLDTGVAAVRLELPGEPKVRMRLDADQLLIADDHGRVRVISLDNGSILRDARLHA